MSIYSHDRARPYSGTREKAASATTLEAAFKRPAIERAIVGQAMLVLALILSIFMAIGTAFAQAEVAPAVQSEVKSVVQDQITAFQEQDHSRAYSHAAPNIKQIFKTQDQFIGMVKRGYDPLYNPDSYVFGRNIEINDEIYQEVIVNDSRGRQWQAVYTLRQQPDGSWKITGVKMNPHKGASS